MGAAFVGTRIGAACAVNRRTMLVGLQRFLLRYSALGGLVVAHAMACNSARESAASDAGDGEHPGQQNRAGAGDATDDDGDGSDAGAQGGAGGGSHSKGGSGSGGGRHENAGTSPSAE